MVRDTTFTASGSWQVMGAEVDSNGVVFIADFSLLGVHVAGPRDGTPRVFGRAGDGPGEFRYLYRMRRCGGAILAYDVVHGRVTPVTPAGLDKDEQLPSALRVADFVGCDEQGRRYFTKMLDDPASPGRQIRSIRLLRHAPPGESVDTMVTLPGTEIFVSRRWRAFRTLPFGMQTFVAAGPSGAIYAENSKLMLIAIEEAGRRRTLYSEEPDVRPVTAGDRERYLQEQLQLEPDSAGREKLRRTLAEAPWGNRLPPLDQMIVGQDGVVWVRRTPTASDTAAWWLAVSPNGEAARLLLPRGTRVISARKGSLTVVDALPNGDERVMVVALSLLR